MSLPTIRELNDVLRSTFITGKVVLTEGIRALPHAVREEIITKVRCFDTFTEGDDPYGEHDFGAFDQESAGKIFWKIDYFDLDYEYLSPDPADPKQTRRVLTIMLADEY